MLETDVAADRILVGEVAFRKSLVDDHDRGRVGRVGFSERAPPQQRNLGGCKVSGADGEVAASRAVFWFRDGMAFKREPHARGKAEGQVARQGGGLCLGKICKALQNPLEKLLLARRLEIFESAERNRRGQKIVRVESRACAYFREETLNKNTRAHEQKHGKRELSHYETTLQAISSAAWSGTAAPFLEAIVWVAPGNLNRGCKAEQNSGRHRNSDGEDQHANVHRPFLRHCHRIFVPIQLGLDCANCAKGKKNSQAAAGKRKEQTFGEELTRQTEASSAQDRANRELALARRVAREQKVREIRARNQQHEPNGGH